MKTLIRLAGAVLMVLTAAATTSAQIQPCSANETSPNLPPANSPPLVRCLQPVFHPANDRVTETLPMIDALTYLSYVKVQPSLRSTSRWVPYDEATVKADFWNLYRTGFLEDLWIETLDEPYENGVMGKHIVFHMEERAKVKMVDYLSAVPDEKLKVDISKIESTLRDKDISVRLDSFVDEATLRKVIGVIRDLYAEQGYNDATVTTTRAEMKDGPKLLHLTFKIDPGPKVELAEILFDGNQAFTDHKLRKQMKANKTKTGLLGFLSDATYHEAKFAEDAERIGEFYKINGYATAQVGLPQTEVIRTSTDGKHRWIRVRVPVDEGARYKIGTFQLTGESTLRLEAIRSLFKLEEGDYYSSEKMRKGLEKTKEAYGSYGFWQFSPDPELSPRGLDPQTGLPVGPAAAEPLMDITIHVNEGPRFYVNRITFVGNTNTHDAVIRRELRVAEGGVFNAEALKESVRRLNQLGYFKPIEGKEGETDVLQTPGTDDRVDIKLKLTEQNRNQLAFGAGVSQFDGFFGQLSFQTANFLGRGETVGVSLQKGSQARQYQVSISEPYLLDRPITVGADVFSRQYIFPFQYTQESSGSNVVFGFPVANFTRGFLNYSYERIRVKDLSPAYSQQLLSQNLYLRDSLLIDQGGQRIVSKISPSVVYNTVNQPIFPSAGSRYTASMDVAGLGGNTSYLQSRLDGIWYVPLSRRTALGLHAESQYIRPYGSTTTLPIFEKLFSGGEYSVRGYDLRSVSPRDAASGLLTGGNKMVTVNAEYYVTLFGQVRVLGFYDASQVRDIGQRFGWKEPITQLTAPALPFLSDPFGVPNLLTTPGAIRTEVIGHTSAFKTSTGIEARFMMPVLNVPFRLIGAYNPQRQGVLDNQLQPSKRFTFRFAVGTTF
ncbi:MAG: outer membrane protein assembly factor BamA [Vicinamibacterales bacterium]